MLANFVKTVEMHKKNDEKKQNNVMIVVLVEILYFKSDLWMIILRNRTSCRCKHR